MIANIITGVFVLFLFVVGYMACENTEPTPLSDRKWWRFSSEFERDMHRLRVMNECDDFKTGEV